MKTIIFGVLLIQVIASFQVAQAENRLSKGISSLVNSLPNFSQFPVVANRTLLATIQEWQRIQNLAQERASNDVILFQKAVQSLTHDVNTLTTSNSFSLTNYKAYLDLYVNYRTELLKLVSKVANDVYTLITVELPKSFHRIMLAVRQQAVLLL